MVKRLFSLLVTLMLVFALPMVSQAESVVYPFSLTQGTEAMVDGLLFEGDVVISGNNAKLVFSNCTFLGDLILTADEGTMVVMVNCTLMGKCIQRNQVKEANMDYSLPKFATDAPVELVLEDCIGAVVAMGYFPVVYEGQVYSMAQSQLYYDSGSIVPYEGQEANYFYLGRWWEGGEEVIFTMAEYDPAA